MNDPTVQTQRDNLDVIDLRIILHPLFRAKKFLVFAGLASLLISALYSYSRPPVYESSIRLIPSGLEGKSSALGGAAALLGGKAKSDGDQELYQSLLRSTMAVRQLLRSEVVDRSDSGRGQKMPLAAALRIDTTDPISVRNGVNSLITSISVRPKDARIVEVTAKSEVIWLPEQVVENIVDIGQSLAEQIQAERYSSSIEKMQQATVMAQHEWDSAARVLSAYKDKNRAISLPSQQFELDRMSLEKSAKEQTYLLVKRELEQTKIERMKSLPPMMLLDNAESPIQPSGPKRMRMALLIWGASMFFLCGCVVLKDRLTGCNN